MKTIWFFLSISVLLLGGESFASHNAWVLKHSGGQCVPQNSSSNYGYPGVFENTRPTRVRVECPITAASQGSRSIVGWRIDKDGDRRDTKEKISRIDTHVYWAAARKARIFFKGIMESDRVRCRAVARDYFGNLAFGPYRHFSPNPTGGGFLDLVDGGFRSEGTWDLSGLETRKTRQAMMLFFICDLGPGRVSNPPTIIGYDVWVCQQMASCQTSEGDRDNTRLKQGSVQGSGIECASSTKESAPFLKRSERGIINIDQVSEIPHSIHCPITQVVDDSYEHQRKIVRGEVFFSGTFLPNCKLESFDEQGIKTSSPNLVIATDIYGRRILLLEDFSGFAIGYEKSLSLQCDIPQATTLEGYILRMTMTRESAGT